jgi:hypothetical protein
MSGEIYAQAALYPGEMATAVHRTEDWDGPQSRPRRWKENKTVPPTGNGAPIRGRPVSQPSRCTGCAFAAPKAEITNRRIVRTPYF